MYLVINSPVVLVILAREAAGFRGQAAFMITPTEVHREVLRSPKLPDSSEFDILTIPEIRTAHVFLCQLLTNHSQPRVFTILTIWVASEQFSVRLMGK